MDGASHDQHAGQIVPVGVAAAWIVASGLYSFPAFQEEVAEKRYLARIARVQAPVIPVDCSGARGVESRDFIREDKNRHRCWVDLSSFRRLYPEIAEYTDEAASARINMQAELPLDKWDGSPSRSCSRPARWR